MNEINERDLRVLEVLLLKYLKGQEGTPAAYLHQTLGYVRASLDGAQRKIADTNYSKREDLDLVEDANLVRELVIVEILSEGGTGNRGLSVLSVNDGDWSCIRDTLLHERVRPELMAGLLDAQGSSPEFLLGG